MTLSGSARRLMVIVAEDNRYDRKPLYMEIVKRARDAGLAGASAFRGVEGFGHSHHLHTARLLDLMDRLPVMIIMIDAHEKIERFVPQLADLMAGGGILAVDDVEVLTVAPSQ